MANGDTKTNQYLNIAANGTRADLPSDTCCETRSQTLIREVAERIINVEEEVDELKNNPDVVDIVDTYEDLENYNTSSLTDKDIIRVLNDESHDGESTYYRWSTGTNTWIYIGSAGSGGATVVQTTGTSKTAVMSQNATTVMGYGQRLAKIEPGAVLANSIVPGYTKDHFVVGYGYEHFVVPVEPSDTITVVTPPGITNFTCCMCFLTQYVTPTDNGDYTSYLADGVSTRQISADKTYTTIAPAGAAYYLINTKFGNNDVMPISFTLKKGGEGEPIDLLTYVYGGLYQDIEAVNAKIAQPVMLENPLLHEYMTITDYSDDPNYTKSVMYDNFYATKIIQDNQDKYIHSRPFPVEIKFDVQTGVTAYNIFVGEDLHEFSIDITNTTGSGANYTYSVDNGVVTFNVYNLFPDREYSYFVYCYTSTTSVRKLITSGRVRTEGQVRMIYADNVYNMRDVGGWQTADGKTIKYGKLYRGTEIDGFSGRGLLEADGMTVFNELGITSEIDVDTVEATPNVRLPDYNNFTIAAYVNGLSNPAIQPNYKKIIDKVAENAQNGVGTYIHCQAGLDRTGTTILLIEGLLGVEEDYMVMDYEISTMNTGVPNVNDPSEKMASLAYRTYTNFKDMITWFKTNYTGTNYTLNDSIRDYCLSIGVTQETIDILRHEMLDDKVVKQYVTEKDVNDILFNQAKKEADRVFGEGNYGSVYYDGVDETWTINTGLVIDGVTHYRFLTAPLADLYSDTFKNNRKDFAIVAGDNYILSNEGNSGVVSSGVTIIQSGSAGNYTYTPYVYLNPVNPITTVDQFKAYLKKHPIAMFYPKQPSS